MNCPKCGSEMTYWDGMNQWYCEDCGHEENLGTKEVEKHPDRTKYANYDEEEREPV